MTVKIRPFHFYSATKAAITVKIQTQLMNLWNIGGEEWWRVPTGAWLREGPTLHIQHPAGRMATCMEEESGDMIPSKFIVLVTLSLVASEPKSKLRKSSIFFGVRYWSTNSTNWKSSKNFNFLKKFQKLSRSWNRILRIQGFPRRTNTVMSLNVDKWKTQFFRLLLWYFRFYDDEEGESEGGASEEERAFRCKLIADEFAKRRKVLPKNVLKYVKTVDHLQTIYRYCFEKTLGSQDKNG